MSFLRKSFFSKTIIFTTSLLALMVLSACPGESDDSGMLELEMDLDLREANVIQVQYDAQTGQFDVTLLHDDDGEPGYADWWQVESLDGTLFGRRELTHAHGTQAFTRSLIIVIPAGTDFVVVRGHDQTHGYGGQAIVFHIASSSQEKIQQGSDSVDFSNYPVLAKIQIF